jgi:hypothetical protein
VPRPADRVEHWPIERLIPYANNPRLHSEVDLAKITASILKWGWTNPVLVDEQGVLIAGQWSRPSDPNGFHQHPVEQLPVRLHSELLQTFCKVSQPVL